MYDFGDESVIESLRIPLLIWVQLLVFFLLVFLLYWVTLLTLDLSNDSTATTSSASSSTTHFGSDHNQTHFGKPLIKHTTVSVLTNRLEITQVGEHRSVKGGIKPSTSRRIVRGDDIVEMEDSLPTIGYFLPCNYFRLATLAFLKCFGFDSSMSENSSTSERRKGKEQSKRKKS